MRSRGWLIAAFTVVAALMSPVLEQVSAQSGPGIVISEFRFRGPAGANDEFIELYNAAPDPVNIGGWLIRVSNNVMPPGVGTRATITANTIVNPGCYYLLTNSASGGYTGGVAGNQTYAAGFADDGGLAVTLPNLTIVDQVGHGANGAFGEGTRLPVQTTNVNRGIERRPGSAAGHADTNNNAADFQEIVPANPQNASSACLAAAFHFPHEVQGAGATSPLAGTSLTVRGVVTARASDGFFIQTAAGDEDADPNTSEGLFVFTGGPPPAAPVGHLVGVAGVVSEYMSAADPGSPTATRLGGVTTVTDLGAAPVPAPYVLTSADVSDAGTLDQLERLEGMRVTAASLTAVSPSSNDGVFFAVLSGQARPFREPGVEAGYPVLPCAIGPCNVPLFDGNPERLRLDADALQGTVAANVATGAMMTGVTGPLDFGSRTYTVLPESTLSPSGGATPLAAPPAPADHFTVGSLNLNRFLDANDETRLAKASLTVRAAMSLPDVVGLQEVENLAVLQALSARIDADEAAAGNPAPVYEAVLVEHANQDGLDVAFLVKSGRVTPLSVEQVGADPGNEHPSLVLQALVTGPPTSLPQAVTVIANHLPSNDLSARQAQAELLADYVQGRQNNDPGEAIVSVGGYNAFSFNDGYVDVVGTVRGVPASPDLVALASPDLVSPDLVDAAGLAPADQRYSFVFNGNAQAHDHVLVSATLESQLVDLVHARVNTDFPEVLAGDATTPSRLSDRDPLVAYFMFPPDVNAPVFATPSDQVAEATGPDGAAVTFDTPVATDNLDPTVAVTCAPLSGSMFPLGNSGVTCSAQDVAGNGASVSFTVTVQDTTAPVLTVPDHLTDEASSPAGQVMAFVAAATDVVTVSPTVACTPASGSTFPLGGTTVSCVATDAAGNTATGSFVVTVTLPVLGRMAGAGHVAEDQQVWFAFDVREAANFVEKGWVMLQVRDGQRRPDRLMAASVSDVRFSSSAGYAPGRWPRSGVDTVTFSGSGWWNGEAGHSFEITASDHGEPGRGHDTFSLVVRAPNGDVVESAYGTLRDGNIQSLR